MSTFTNAATANGFMTGANPLPTPAGTEITAARFTINLGVADLAVGRIGAFAQLPAGAVPVDLIVDGTDMDNGAAAMVLTFGVLATPGALALSTAAADGGGAWGATAATNTAFTQRITPTLNNMMNVRPAAADRLVGCIVTTAPTTPVAGTLGLTLLYRNA